MNRRVGQEHGLCACRDLTLEPFGYADGVPDRASVCQSGGGLRHELITLSQQDRDGIDGLHAVESCANEVAEKPVELPRAERGFGDTVDSLQQLLARTGEANHGLALRFVERCVEVREIGDA